MSIAVTPKRDCPHVESHVAKLESWAEAVKFGAPCATCSSTEENWQCLSCHSIGCSRYQAGHAAEHHTASGHAIALSFSDASVWCYLCESYIVSPVLKDALRALGVAKFGDKEGGVETIERLLARLSTDPKPAAAAPEKVLQNFTLEEIAGLIKSGKCRNIVVMTGAGISVSAGIPDFRTPGTGLYSNLQKYNLPQPEAVFEINFFRSNPQPFYTLARELYPDNFTPTPTHFFIRLLHEKGVLLRNYTQNIDTLERVAGVPADKMVEAHGSFGGAACIDCQKTFDPLFVKQAVFAKRVARCECGGLVKPTIVFFGESLPALFFERSREDLPSRADLLIVMGTSLVVHPFASLVDRVGPAVPRLLLNREPAGCQLLSGGLKFHLESNTRDVFHRGDCDSSVWQLAELLGWKADLEALIAAHKAAKAAAAAAEGAADATADATAATAATAAPAAPAAAAAPVADAAAAAKPAAAE